MVLFFLLLFPVFSFAQNITKLTWHGHSAFEISTPKGQVLMIDPWLNNPTNPVIKEGADAVKTVKKCNYILVTHGHSDHVGDAVAIAKSTKARLVASYELGTNMVRALGYPENLVNTSTLGNSGGDLVIAGGEVVVTFTPAVHSSSLEVAKNEPLIYAGNPNGFVIKIQNGPTIYHSGDTDYFEDMKEIGSYGIDVALLNIGGHFGMEPDAAVKAAVAIKPKLVIPHHFGTFPFLTKDTLFFFQALDKKNLSYLQLKQGVPVEFEGKVLKPLAE